MLWVLLDVGSPSPNGIAFVITLLSLNESAMGCCLGGDIESPDSDSLLSDELLESVSELLLESLESELLALSRLVLSACEFSVSENV